MFKKKCLGTYNGVEYYTEKEREYLKKIEYLEKDRANNLSKCFPVLWIGDWKKVCPVCKGEVEKRLYGDYSCKNCPIVMVDAINTPHRLFEAK